MNCQETPRRTPKCSCCDQCKKEQNGKSWRSSPPQNYRTTQGRPIQGDSYYENYAVPDDDYRGGNTYSKLRSSSCDGSGGGRNWIDSSTFRTLADLRQRACEFIEASEAVEASEDEYVRCSGQEPWQDSPTRRRVQELDYSPQSTFLRKMKKRNEEMSSNRVIGPNSKCFCSNGDGPETTIFRPQQPPCTCCKCPPPCGMQTMQGSVPYETPYVRERTTPYSDISSIHDPCTCFRTWRPKPFQQDCADYQLELLGNDDGLDVSDDQQYFQECLDDDTGPDPAGAKTRKKKGRCGHVSRSDKRKRRTGRRKGRPRRCSLSPDIDFEPTLKRPHPNSCERCWRYASPSRSPVNKPSQRFDPNYRRSHSQVTLASGSRGRVTSSRGSRDSKTNLAEFDPETKVSKLASSLERISVRSKSADNLRKGKADRPATAKPSFDRKSKDAAGKALKRQDSATALKRASQNRSCLSKQDASQRSCVNFDAKVREPTKRPTPVQCSPSMFEKSNRKSTTKKSVTSSRPSTPGSATQAKRKEKPRQRPSSEKQSQAFDECPEKQRPRSQSFQREPFDVTDFSENVPPIRIKQCRCTKPPDPAANGMRRELPGVWAGSRDGFSVPKCCAQKSFEYQHESRRRNSDAARNCAYCSCCKVDGSPRPPPKEPGPCQCYRKDAPVTLWDRRGSRGDTEAKRGRSRDQKNRTSDDCCNPRKYCVFYMNSSKENKDDDIEVLIEELTRGNDAKGGDSKREAVKEKMKRMREQRMESMALRFQKGIAEKCKRPENNRLLYF